MSRQARSATAEELDHTTDSGDTLHEAEEQIVDDVDDEVPAGEGKEDADAFADSEFLAGIAELANQDEDLTEPEEETEEDREIAAGLDDDEEDDDEPLDDEELDDDEEDEPHPEDPRRTRDGRYRKTATEVGKSETVASSPTPTGADATPKVDGGDKPKVEQSAPAWEPFKVNADKAEHVIAEARITRANGNVLIAVPEAEYNRFAARISRGVQFENKRQIIEEGLRELEARKTAPPAPTKEQVAAQLMTEMLKPYLADLFDAEEIDALEKKVDAQLAQELATYNEAEQKRVAEASAQPWEEEQYSGIASQIHRIRAEDPQLSVLTDEEIKDVYLQELVPVRDALYFREGEQRFANTEYMHARLVARAKLKGAASASAANPTAGTPAAGSPAAPTAHKPSPADASSATKKAERFNRGAQRTTNLKARRDTARPRDQRNTRGERAAAGARRSERETQEQLEDQKRKQTRRFMNSDSLDFDDGDDE
jgi:hypothetical protein